MRSDFVNLAADAPGAANAATSSVTLAMPVIMMILAFLMLANGKAPKLAGLCLFLAGVGLSGTAIAGSLSTSAHTILAGTIDGITNSLK
ncbi:hypothetical protein [Yinghuangia seranimata]|uniref:hypothetical protein n=1 Tax=Yinghuangia seranimata TaxID=408067 RepID=UPI00248C8EA5|nr:hypothetical protein [Yinghuangia seranimata]MDI2127798.1 hypothetical protein [Yinghuangia seranimata]